MALELNCRYIRFLRKTAVNSNGSVLTCNELADEIGVHWQTILNIENNTNYNAGIFTLHKLAKYFNVTLDSLLKAT